MTLLLEFLKSTGKSVGTFLLGMLFVVVCLAVFFAIVSFFSSGVRVNIQSGGELEIEYRIKYMPIKTIILRSQQVSYYKGRLQRGTTILVIGKDSLQLYDRDNDGKVEKVVVKMNVYIREQEGTEKLFKDADELLEYYIKKVNFHNIVREELAKAREIPRLK